MAMFQLVQLLLGACLVGVTFAKSEAEVKKYIMGLGLQCNQENPLNPEDMAMLHEHKIPDKEAPKCFLACVFRKATWMDNKGMFDVAAATAHTAKEHSDDADKAEKSKKVFELCKKVNDETASDGEKGCERAAMLARCLIENSPKMGLAIVV